MAAEKIDALELDITSKTSSESIDKLIESLSRLSKELDKLHSKKVNVAISETGTASKNAASGVDRLSNSFLTQTIRITALIAVARKLGSVIQSSIANSATYIKTLNMFTVSLGDYADNAAKYGQTVSDALGIDIAGWQDTQGVFQTLIKGMGITGEKAAFMSQNLTQLTYDIASFYGITTQEAATKLKSAMAGRTQPVRQIGYNVSQSAAVDYAKNPANYGKQTFAINAQTGAWEANTLSVEKNTQHKIVNYNQMKASEKGIIAYNNLMSQNTQIQGNFARSLNDPYNQLKIFKEQLNQTSRSFGNMFIPALNKVMPYLNAFVQLVGEAFQALANLFGFELPDMKDRTSIDTKPYDNVVKATGKAAKNAKKMKDYMLGIDELNVFNPNTGATGGTGSKKGEQTDVNNMLLKGYDFLSKAIENSLKEAKKTIQKFFKDLKDNPFLLKDLFVWGGEKLFSKFWEKVLGKTPEELQADALKYGRSTGEQFIIALSDALRAKFGEAGSSIWAALLGKTPEQLAQEAEANGTTVGQAFMDSVYEKLTGVDIISAVFGSPTDLAEEAEKAGITVSDAFTLKMGTALGKFVDSNPVTRWLYKLQTGRDIKADLAEFNQALQPKKKSAYAQARKDYSYKSQDNAKTLSEQNQTRDKIIKRSQEVKLTITGNTAAQEAQKQGEKYIKAFTKGIKDGESEVKNSTLQAYNAATNGLNADGTAKQKVGYISADMAKAYYENLATKQSLNATKAEAKKLPKAAVSGASAENGIGKGFYKTGEQSGQGYVLGIEAPRNIKKYKEASKTMGTNTLDALKKFLNIKSPSRATMELGDYAAQGFALGIENNAYLSKNAARNMASSALSAIGNASNLSNKVILNGTLADPTATGRVSMPTVNSGYGVGMANEGAMASLASSIYQAVVSGMSNATATAGSGGDIKVVIDGKEVFKAVQAESRKRGANISNGAFSR